MDAEYKNNQNVSAISETSTEFIKAVRLMDKPDGSCTFEKGKIPTLKKIETSAFWISTKTEEWEKNAHVAPRRQYVITIKGNIRFKVSNGSTFMIEPGVILLAEDLKGEGHSWDMIDGTEWVRIYIPIPKDADDFFIPDA